MKISSLLILVLLSGCLILQGCASTNPARPDAPEDGVSATNATAPKVLPKVASAHVVTADTKPRFEAVAAAVMKQMEPGGRFGFVDKSGRQTVEGKLADMRLLFDQYASVDKMTNTAQQRLLGDQNSINEVLARHDRNRLICWKETPVGTHFPKTVCRTLGQIQLEQNQSRQRLDRMTYEAIQKGDKILRSQKAFRAH